MRTGPVERHVPQERPPVGDAEFASRESVITEGATDWRRWRVTADADTVTVRTWTSTGKLALLTLLGALVLGACVLTFPRMSTEPGAIGGIVVVWIAIAVVVAYPFLLFVGLAREEVTITRTTARVMRSNILRSRVRVSDIGHSAHVRTVRRISDLPGHRLEIKSAAQTVRLGSWMAPSAARTTAECIGRLLLASQRDRGARSGRVPSAADGSATAVGVVRPVAPNRIEKGGKPVREPVLLPDVTAPADGLRWVEGAEAVSGIDWLGGQLLARGAIGAALVAIAAGAGAVYLMTAAAVALILLFAPGGVLDARRRSRLRSMARRHPGEPWLWTNVWTQPIAGARGGVRRLRGDNVDHVVLPATPCTPSGRLTLEFIAGVEPIAGDVTFTLRRLAAMRPDDEGVRRVALTHIGRAVAPARVPGEAIPVTFEFAEPAAGTRLGSRDAAIWVLVAEGRTPDGREFRTEFPLPLFEEA